MRGGLGVRGDRECSGKGTGSEFQKFKYTSLGGPWRLRWGEVKGEVGRVQSSLELVSPHIRGSEVFTKGRRCG